MTKINTKKIRAGDKLVLRCGAKLVVRDVEKSQYFDNSICIGIVDSGTAIHFSYSGKVRAKISDGKKHPTNPFDIIKVNPAKVIISNKKERA